MKPNDLVVLTREVYPGTEEQFRWAHVGEVMSYQTERKTIMVRTTPGWPGTMHEFPVDRCAPCSLNPLTANVHYATLGGNGRFPLDMLRYDSCSPVNFAFDEGDIAVIDSQFGFDEYLISTTQPSFVKQRFTVSRWESFGWRCVPTMVESLRTGGVRPTRRVR